jgi:hypothetical protein
MSREKAEGRREKPIDLCVPRYVSRRDFARGLLALPMLPRRFPAAGEWTRLFNGRDLTGWKTFLGKPHASVDLPGPRTAKGEHVNVVGIDTDPRGVFSVVSLDGGPAIRISGEIYGALTTRAQFENYHLRLQFKWGEKRWPPREKQIRDTGCCYHALPPHGASYGFWMRSCEFQIQEGEVGDFYSLAGVIVDAEAVAQNPADPKSEYVYTPGAKPVIGHTRRLIKSGNYERPRGEWNTLELYCFGQRSVHIVNGHAVMRLSDIRQPTPSGTLPLTKGHVQLQSEGGEVFYRDIEVRQIAGLEDVR